MLGVSKAKEEVVFQILFPYSLIGKSNEWCLDQPTSTLTNWDALEEKFLNRFFPNNKFMKAKKTIFLFSQDATETLCDA